MQNIMHPAVTSEIYKPAFLLKMFVVEYLTER